MAGVIVVSAPAISNRRLDSDFTSILDIDAKSIVAINGRASCTGTFLNPTTALTSAHCIDLRDPTGGVSVEGVQSIRAFHNQHYDPEKAIEVADYYKAVPHDLALVVFPKGTGRFLGIRRYATISDTFYPAHINEKIYLIGYGAYTFKKSRTIMDDEFGLLGWGWNTITGIAEGGLLFETSGSMGVGDKSLGEGSGESAFCLDGDSGSGVYISTGEIIGICDATRVFRQDTPEKVLSLYTPANSGISTALFKKAILCATPPCADNFKGSGIEQTFQSDLSSASSFDPQDAVFKHTRIANGLYRDISGKARDISVNSDYVKNEIIMVSIWGLEGLNQKKSHEQFIFLKSEKRFIALEWGYLLIDDSMRITLHRSATKETYVYTKS